MTQSLDDHRDLAVTEPVPQNGELPWTDEATLEHEGLSSCACRTVIPDAYPFFEGHFRGYPVMAGVVQLHELVLPCVRRVRPELGSLAGLSGLKFPERIEPGQSVEVLLRWEKSGLSVSFEIRNDSDRCTLGRLVFEQTGTAP